MKIPWNLQDLTGKRFGRWMVRGGGGRRKDGTRLWDCICDCGTQRNIPTGKLNNGHTTSCGCYHHELVANRNRVHGFAVRGNQTVEYKKWKGMIARCYQPSFIGYRHYGGRGIRVCERWRGSFIAFLKDMGPCPAGFTIERKDVNGNYCPENCKWLPRSEQNWNTRKNKWVRWDGKRLLCFQWDELLGFPRGTTYNRIWNGWPIERTLTTPVKHQKAA